MDDKKTFSDLQKKYWGRERLENRRPPTHPVVSAYVLPKIEAICRCIKIENTTSLLDVGCGNGFFTYYFDQICNTQGIDISEKMLRMNPIKKKFQMDAADLKIADGTFDIVFCHGLLHHVENPERIVSEMKRVSKKYVVMLEPNRNNPFIFLLACFVREERKCFHFSLSYLRRLAERNALHILDAFSCGMILPNKIPTLFLPLLRLFNFCQPFATTHFVIAEK